MNSFEIEKTVARDKCLSKHFVGVFPSDRLPVISTKPACFIANIDPSNKPGQHWVSMFFDKETEYFDSYGLEPEGSFATYKPAVINRYCLQDIGSTVCGEYCIYYLAKRVRGLSLERVVSSLINRGDSDQVVKRYVDKLRIVGLTDKCQSCAPRP